MIEEQGDEFASRAGTGLVEDRLQVVLDGVCGEMESLPDVVGGKALCHQFGDSSFAVGEPVGVGDQGCELGRLCVFDQDGDRGVWTVAENRTPHGYPIPLCGTDSRPRKRVGPRLAPFGIIPIIAGDAPCPCCDGEHGNRQFRTWCVTGDEIGEQALSFCGGRVDRVVRGEDNDPGPALVACRDVTEDGSGEGRRPGAERATRGS